MPSVTLTIVLPRFYDYLKSQNPDEWKMVDVQTAAKFYKRPDNRYPPLAIEIAVHKHLMDHPRKFIAHPTAYRETQTFLVRPSDPGPKHNRHHQLDACRGGSHSERVLRQGEGDYGTSQGPAPTIDLNKAA
jgi:hypothetical protein